jgi:hypothetical protein
MNECLTPYRCEVLVGVVTAFQSVIYCRPIDGQSKYHAWWNKTESECGAD